MVRSIVLIVALIAGCSDTEPAICKNSLGAARTADKHVLSKQGNSDNVVVLAIDTDPSKRSALFEAVLQYYDYEYYLLGNGPTAQQTHPAKTGLFKEYFFSYRMFKYQAAIEQIILERGPNAIIIISDANDVMFALGPSDLANKFKSVGFNVVLSGEMLTTATRLPYIQRLAKELHMEEVLESTEPETVKLVQLLRDFVLLKGTKWGYGDAPFVLWMPEVQETVRLIKKIPIYPQGPATKYRYVNGGGIIGYAGALQKAFQEMNIKVGDDDQAKWNRWYGEIGYPTGVAMIDYQRKALAQVNDFFDMHAAFRLLFDDFPSLPTKHPFQFIWDPMNMPVAYHCAGCEQPVMRDFHRQIVNTLQARYSVFTQEQVQFANECR